MRSYGQYCALARALDVVGDRWTLLIVRELLVRPCRYRDLLDGLPGVATNLLADRLRHLEAHGVVERTRDDGVRYRLTERGLDLSDAVLALGRWGAPLLAHDDGDYAVRSHWFVVPIQSLYQQADPDRPDMTVDLRLGDQLEPLALVSADGEVKVQAGPAPGPVDLVVEGPGFPVVGLLAGLLPASEAPQRGIRVTGSGGFRRLARLRPDSH